MVPCRHSFKTLVLPFVPQGKVQNASPHVAAASASASKESIKSAENPILIWEVLLPAVGMVVLVPVEERLPSLHETC